MAAEVDDRNAEVVRRLEVPKLSVACAMLRGRPATLIIDEPRTFAADLIVMGSRGQGADCLQSFQGNALVQDDSVPNRQGAGSSGVESVQHHEFA